jgi:hypothetical protein
VAGENNRDHRLPGTGQNNHNTWTKGFIKSSKMKAAILISLSIAFCCRGVAKYVVKKLCCMCYHASGGVTHTAHYPKTTQFVHSLLQRGVDFWLPWWYNMRKNTMTGASKMIRGVQRARHLLRAASPQ